MTINNFDVLKTMSERNLDIKASFQIVDATTSGGTSTVTMQVDEQTVMNFLEQDKEKHLFCLLVYNKEQFEAVKKEMGQKPFRCPHCGGTEFGKDTFSNRINCRRCLKIIDR